MWVFYILMLIPIAMQHFVTEGRPFDYRKKNQNALLAFFVILTILVALRHESVGNDTRNYINYFELYSKTSWAQLVKSDMELGFAVFNKLASLVTQEPQVFFAIVAIATTVMIYPTYKRLCIDASLMIVLYVFMSTFVMMFSGIRQMIAVGIGFLAYECTRNKKLVLWAFCVVLAILFHASAFMLIFMYPLYHARITKKWLFAVVPAMVIVFVFNEQIFSYLGMFLSRYTGKNLR